LAIFAFSSIPLRTRLTLISIVGVDKAFHLIEYGILGLVICRAVHPAGREFWWKYAMIAVVLTAGYGITDELHQYFTPGRVVDPWDVLADSFGAVLAAVLWPLSVRRWPRLYP